jgi:hypothetical protein
MNGEEVKYQQQYRFKSGGVSPQFSAVPVSTFA